MNFNLARYEWKSRPHLSLDIFLTIKLLTSPLQTSIMYIETNEVLTHG